MEKIKLFVIENKEKLRKIFLFLLKAVVIYRTIIFIFYAYIALIDSQGRFDFSDTLGKINLVQVLRDSVILPASMILEFLGYQTWVTEVKVGILGYSGVEMNFACLGVETWSALACLLFAYADNTLFKNKLNYFILCVVIMQVLNIIRIAGVAIANALWYSHANDHHHIYNFVIYGFIILCFYYWIDMVKRKGGDARTI